MGGYKGIKADGGKVNQAKQLAAKIAKDIEACQKQTQQLAEYIEGSDWEGQFANKGERCVTYYGKVSRRISTTDG